MTADGFERSDTTCPSCDEPVGTRATFCMHCGRDLPDRTDYDDVTGQAETDAGGETLLSRLRPGKRRAETSTDDAGTPAVVESDTGTVGDGTVDDGTFDTGSADDDTVAADALTSDATRRGTAVASATGFSAGERQSASESRIPVPSGLGTDGPTYLPTDGLFSESDAAAKLLGVLGLVGVTGVFGLGVSLAGTGALLAVLAWAVSVVAIGRRHTGFDAMRYGSFTMMVLLICVSFAFAFSSVGGGLLSLGLTLVPVAIAALLVAGFGYGMGGSPVE